MKSLVFHVYNNVDEISVDYVSQVNVLDHFDRHEWLQAGIFKDEDSDNEINYHFHLTCNMSRGLIL
jgi:hypothetical protein